MEKKILFPILAFFALVDLIIGLVWLGFRIRPEPLPKTTKNRTVGTVDIPTTLPDPVHRYLRATAGGDKLPLVKSVVLWGDGTLKRGPLRMPIRYWVAHLPGYHFRRMMEITWFGIPVIKGMDEYVNGQGKTTIAGQRVTSPQINQAANLMLWVEAIAMPSLFITDPRIRWETVNNTTARLIVPFEDREDAVTFYFDEQTDLINRISALRYKNNSDKILWTVEFLEWHPLNGGMYPAHIAVTWADEDTPWSNWYFDAMDYNVDLTPFIPEIAVGLPTATQPEAVPA